APDVVGAGGERRDERADLLAASRLDPEAHHLIVVELVIGGRREVRRPDEDPAPDQRLGRLAVPDPGERDEDEPAAVRGGRRDADLAPGAGLLEPDEAIGPKARRGRLVGPYPQQAAQAVRGDHLTDCEPAGSRLRRRGRGPLSPLRGSRGRPCGWSGTPRHSGWCGSPWRCGPACRSPDPDLPSRPLARARGPSRPGSPPLPPCL